MNAKLCLLCATLLLVSAGGTCLAIEPDDAQSIAHLRREIAELRQEVAQLKAQLKSQLATNEATLRTPSVILRVPRDRLGIWQIKKIEPSSNGSPQIPIEVERAMMAPPWRLEAR